MLLNDDLDHEDLVSMYNTQENFVKLRFIKILLIYQAYFRDSLIAC